LKSISVSVIGLGQMGSALVAPFLNAGNKVTVWNRSAEKAVSLSGLGAHVAPSLLAAIEASELIIVCLRDYDTSDALFKNDAIESALKGKTLLQLTTGTRAEAERSASWAHEAGFSYLDGAIMDYPTVVGTDACLLLASGPEAAYQKYAEYLRVLGGRFTYVGSNPAAANLLDGGLLTIYYGATFGFLQSAAMLAAEDVAVSTLKHALDSFLPVLHSSFKRCADLISRGDYSGNEASVLVHSLGVQSLLKRAKSAGVEHDLLELFTKHLEKTTTLGFEEAELPAVFETFRSQ
jgi:3-hydroxyisobutyrate dehydrogenase-like beta-hydroxyacid dehydrogenase